MLETQEICPLADFGWLFRFRDEKAASGFHQIVHETQFHWARDLVPAYKSVAVFHNPGLISMDHALVQLQNLLLQPFDTSHDEKRKIIVVPCCYSLGPDLDRVAELKSLTTDEVIKLHSEKFYKVYAIGFTPGFPYMGYLHEKLQGVPRLETPRVKVEAGSVGLTGVQTGIYPEEKPGGWNLVGKTPLLLVDLEKSYFAFQPGDQIKFEPISPSEFRRIQKQNK